jgi:hypothetical protein
MVINGILLPCRLPAYNLFVIGHNISIHTKTRKLSGFLVQQIISFHPYLLVSSAIIIARVYGIRVIGIGSAVSAELIAQSQTYRKGKQSVKHVSSSLLLYFD